MSADRSHSVTSMGRRRVTLLADENGADINNPAVSRLSRAYGFDLCKLMVANVKT
jgi:hypothetical protein